MTTVHLLLEAGDASTRRTLPTGLDDIDALLRAHLKG
jgi:hypothetical protein